MSQENGGVRIVIPAPRRHPAALIAMLMPLAIPLVMLGPLAQFFQRGRTPDAVSWIFLGFFALMFGVLPASAALHALLRSRLGGTIVTVSTEGIRIEERGVWRTKTVASLPASEIIDVDYSTSESVIGSARRAAERRVVDAGQPSSGSPAIGARTEWVLSRLSRFAKGRGITVKTRQGITTFGHGLPDEEILYLQSVVRRELRQAVTRPASPV